MKMSFIVLCYNQVKEIDQVIESIFSQNISYSFEVIVSDDGSDDGTIEKIRMWQQKYPNHLKLLIQHRDNSINIHFLKRITSSLICAMSHMKGEYFCIFDGDDYCVNKNFAVEAIDVMDNNKNIDSVVFDFEYRYADRTKKVHLGNMQQGIINKYDFFRKFYVHSGSFVFRNHLTDEQRKKFFSLPIIIDNIIIPFMIRFGDLYYIPKLSYSYKVHGGIWKKNTEQQKALLNLIITEIVSKAAFQFKWAIFSKMRNYIVFIYKNRKRIDHHIVSEYLKITGDYNSKISKYLLNYNKINNLKKLLLKLFILYILTMIYLDRSIFKIFRKIHLN